MHRVDVSQCISLRKQGEEAKGLANMLKDNGRMGLLQASCSWCHWELTIWGVKIPGSPGFSEAEPESVIDCDTGLVERVGATRTWGPIFIPTLSSSVISCKWLQFSDAQLQFG